MRVASIRAQKFKRFEDLTIDGIGPQVRLVVVSGANGSGKSGILEALNQFRRSSRWGMGGALDYFVKKSDAESGPQAYYPTTVSFHGPQVGGEKLAERMWIRPAFRHQTEFDVSAIQRQTTPGDDPGLDRLIAADALVAGNYSRLLTSSVANLFDDANRDVPAGVLVDQIVGELQRAMLEVFGDLQLDNLSNPLGEGTFYFTKGSSKHFSFANLSAGERAAFDILLDIVVRRELTADLLYGIDEPELHLGSAVQGRLLDVLLRLLPGDTSQLWIATHSLGMLKRAVELHAADSESIAFIDTYGQNFDAPAHLTPRQPNRDFWRTSLEVALDDMAALISPGHVVLCEGQEIENGFDAACYRAIFRGTHQDTEFLSTGNAFEVKTDKQGVAAAIQILSPGTRVTKLIDRDDLNADEVATLAEEGTRVLTLRNIEGYLLSDEVLTLFFTNHGKSRDDIDALLAEKGRQLQAAVERGKPGNDLKQVAPNMRVYLTRTLGLTGAGSTFAAFAQQHLIPLIQPETESYRVLEEDIFG